MAWCIKKRLMLGLVFLFFSTLGNAQESISVFLGSALRDPQLEIYASQVNYLNKGTYKLVPLRSLELRTQNNQLGSGEQQYGLRISPTNPWEVKYTNQVFRSRQIALSLEQELTFKEVLSKRYQMVSDIIYLNEMSTLKEAISQNTENQIKVLEKQKASSFFDAEDYVELKLALMEDQAAAESFNFELTQKGQAIGQLAPTLPLNSPAWTYATVIFLPRLEMLVDSLLTTPLFTTRLAYREEKIKLADFEHSLEKANVNPGFIQTEYMPYRLGESKNAMGISAGVNIPLFNPNKGDMAAKKLDYLEAKSDLTLEKQEAEEEVKKLTNLLKSSLERHKKLEEKLKTYQESQTLATLNALTKQNPIITLKYNAQLLKLQKIQVELKKNIYQTYIELLTVADIINKKPLVNFFSNSLQPL